MRIVAHVDMDAFFASVEERMNPHLQGKPLAVAGDLKRRGVVSSANYTARPFGVRAGMPVGEALRLCPDLTLVEGNPNKYVHVSLQVLESLKDYTPIVEPFSIDEAFLDLTDTPRRSGGARTLEGVIPIARAIQRAIQRRTELTATIGIAPNKYIAKMASGVEKPRGLTVLSQESYRRHFWPLGVQELWGIGEKTRVALGKLGIETVGQLARFPKEFLTYHFGLNGDRMRDAALGEDDSPVVPYYQGVPVKSMGHEFTLQEDVDTRERIVAHLLRLSDMVARRMRVDGYLGRVIAVKLRDSRFQTTIRQRALPSIMNDEEQIHRTAVALLDENWDGRPLRLIGVSVSGLVKADGAVQPSLFGTDEHRRRMIAAVDSLRDRFGDSSIVRAGILE
ncbi:MAG TPA: DNA polymerase IV [Vicinamibacteria bacterium]|nr:DNA polymerase IV [Vicinamibacteria bacterium]